MLNHIPFVAHVFVTGLGKEFFYRAKFVFEFPFREEHECHLFMRVRGLHALMHFDLVPDA